MDICYKHQIDQRQYIISSYQNQPCPTSLINTTEQTSEPLTTATSIDTNKHLEPIVLYTHINKDQNPKIKYFMKTTLSYISFWITDPTFISIQSDPFLIRLTAPGYEKRTYQTNNRVRFRFTELHVLQQSNAYFYFQPTPQYKNILKEGRVRFQSRLDLCLTDTALATRACIPKGAHLGSLQPVLLSKYLKKQLTPLKANQHSFAQYAEKTNTPSKTHSSIRFFK